MKVKAIAKGYYGGQIRSIGDEFDVPDVVPGAWFVPLVQEGLNPEPQGVEPTPADGVSPTPEATPETDNKPRKPNKQENLK